MSSLDIFDIVSCSLWTGIFTSSLKNAIAHTILTPTSSILSKFRLISYPFSTKAVPALFGKSA